MNPKTLTTNYKRQQINKNIQKGLQQNIPVSVKEFGNFLGHGLEAIKKSDALSLLAGKYDFLEPQDINDLILNNDFINVLYQQIYLILWN